MDTGVGILVRRANLSDEAEIARFQAAFDYDVLLDETRRFLLDERHHLLLRYVDDRPAGFVSAVEVFHPDKRAELFLNEIGVEHSKPIRASSIELTFHAPAGGAPLVPVSLSDLVLASPDTLVDDIMHKQPATVGLHQVDAA
jgi:hypothetical protein